MRHYQNRYRIYFREQDLLGGSTNLTWTYLDIDAIRETFPTHGRNILLQAVKDARQVRKESYPSKSVRFELAPYRVPRS